MILVDNASTDGTPDLLKEIAAEDSRVRLLVQKENLGYSKACNIGLLASKGAHLTALNPDAFVDDGWLSDLGAHLTGNVGAVGPSSDNVAGLQFVGRYVTDRRPTKDELYGILRAEQAGKALPTKLVMGVCLMMRRDLLDKHGLLCEETELGADDLEFSWRSRMLGYELKVVPGVFVHHVGQASFATLPTLEARRRVRLSDRALYQILLAYFGEGNIPSSMELWGCEIFAEALGRRLAA